MRHVIQVDLYVRRIEEIFGYALVLNVESDRRRIPPFLSVSLGLHRLFLHEVSFVDFDVAGRLDLLAFVVDCQLLLVMGVVETSIQFEQVFFEEPGGSFAEGEFYLALCVSLDDLLLGRSTPI